MNEQMSQELMTTIDEVRELRSYFTVLDQVFFATKMIEIEQRLQDIKKRCNSQNNTIHL